MHLVVTAVSFAEVAAALRLTTTEEKTGVFL
jgi:hypothetical protein